MSETSGNLSYNPDDLHGVKEIMYPGLKKGKIIQNLSSYRTREHIGSDSDFESLVFDIERTILGGNQTQGFRFDYSMMLDARYKAYDSKIPSLDSFLEFVSHLEGFLEILARPGVKNCHIFTNDGKNIFVDYIIDEDGNVSIGVIQKNHTASLDKVTDTILPEGVKIHNFINPERAIQNDLLQESIHLAKEGNKKFPTSRKIAEPVM